MADSDHKISELESEIAQLKKERLQLRELVDHLRSLMNQHVHRDPAQMALEFERDLYDAAIQLLSKGRYPGMNDELLAYVHKNSPSADEVLQQLGRKAS